MSTHRRMIRNIADIEPHILLMMILRYEYCFIKIPRKIKMKSTGKVLLETIFILEVIQTEGPRAGGTGTSTNIDKSIIKKCYNWIANGWIPFVVCTTTKW